jgi:hypothetical protein
MLVAPMYNGDELRHEFQSFGRGEQFSRQGFDALYEYLSDLSEDIGRDIQLDVIALCCEWSEYDSIEKACDQYSDDIQTLDDLNDHTLLLFLDNGGLMVRDF